MVWLTVWMTADVDIPYRLIDSLSDGNLVVFAGAGVSIDKPAGMPSFPALLHQLGTEAGIPYQPGEQIQSDVYLSRLVENDFDVHGRVVQILSRRRSPNEYHRDLVAIHGSADRLRIVTTNHDRMFSVAAKRWAGKAIKEYAAPALPVGDDFNGLVYLHGSVKDEPHQLVLTDSDFGRAYLSQGWATTFLRAMFGRFDVLFIGYSHREAVLQYLARGLSGTRLRFALVPEDEDMRLWGQLGIQPLTYPRAALPDEHSALRTVIQRWAERVRMGYREHANRIKADTQGGPPLSPDDVDYIRSLFRDPVTTRQFSESTCSPEWLEFMKTVPEFVQMFRPSQGDERTRWLASWFARNFVLEYPATAQALIQELGFQLSFELWVAIAQTLWTAEEHPSAAVFGSWVTLLMTSTASRVTDYLEYLLSVCRWPEDAQTALVLLWFLTEPRVLVSPRFDENDEGPGVTFRVELQGSEAAISAFFEETLQPHIDDVIDELETLSTAQLERAHAVLESVGGASSDWDYMSLFRPYVDGTDA